MTNEVKSEERAVHLDGSGILSVKKPSHQSDREFFYSGFFKSLFKGFLNPSQTYVFVPTVASELARAVIEENRNELARERGLDPTFHHEYFDEPLLDAYLYALKRLFKGTILKHMQYSLVERKYENNWPNMELPRWPINHVLVDEKNLSVFIGLVDKLRSKEVFEELIEREKPQNYQTPKITLLYKRQIAPLEVLAQYAARFKGDDLIKVLSFFDRYSAGFNPEIRDDD